MIKEVSKRVYNDTQKCRKNFRCLKPNQNVCCKVEHCVNNVVYFVKCSDTTFCSYKVNFGDSSFCTCPVRKEIYNKYRV